MIESKKCGKCLESKDLNCFYRDNRSKNGYQTMCKICNKKYYEKNRDRYQEIKKQDKHKKKVREYFLKNKSDINEYKRKRYETDYGKAKVKALSINRMKKMQSDGTITGDAILNLLEQQNNKCAVTGECIASGNYHVDHKKPISKGGIHTLNNIQLVTPYYNLSKKDRWED